MCYKEGIYEHGQGDPLGAGAGGNRAVGTDAQHVADAALPQPLAHLGSAPRTSWPATAPACRHQGGR